MEVVVNISEMNPGLVMSILGLVAWIASVSVGSLAPSSVAGRMDRTAIGLATVFMLVTVVGTTIAVMGNMA